LKALGYSVFVVWENDFKDERTKTLEGVKEFLGKENESTTTSTAC
jgi:G:T-mismatch repair DNA endonuclease (very short patch repair protein)